MVSFMPRFSPPPLDARMERSVPIRCGIEWGFHESVLTAQSRRIAHRWWESVATELCGLRIILKRAVTNSFMEILTGNFWSRECSLILFCLQIRRQRSRGRILVTDISRFRLQNKASRMLHYVTRQMRFSVVASSRSEHC